MNCEKLLVLVVVFFSEHVTCARKGARLKLGPCKAEKNEYYTDLFKTKCKQCDKCPPGQEHLIKNVKEDDFGNAVECYPCRDCSPGTFKPIWGHDRCVDCKKCDMLSRETARECSGLQDAKCGKCLPGYHDIYKKLYKSTARALNKPCQSCDHAPKDASECNTPIYGTTTQSASSKTTNKEPSSKITKPSPSTSTWSEEQTYKEYGITAGSHHLQELASLKYAWIPLTCFCILVVVLLVFIWRKKYQYCCYRTKDTGKVEQKYSTTSPVFMPRLNVGKSNSSYRSSNEYELCPEVRVLLSSDVTTDGDDTPVDKSTCIGHTVATREHFRLVQNRIGKDWKDLARVLEITEADIEKLEIEHPDVSERIFQLLFLWQKTGGETASIRGLCEALVKVRRHDIAIMLKQQLSRDTS